MSYLFCFHRQSITISSSCLGLVHNPVDRILHLDECEREASRQMRAVKAGRASDNAAAAANQPRVNTEGWKKLIKAFLRSPVRETILSSFSEGTWECEFIRKERHALAFLALQLYFESSGCRFDVISRMTVGYVLDATTLPKPCPWCKEKTRNLKRHKKNCRKVKFLEHYRFYKTKYLIDSFYIFLCPLAELVTLSSSMPLPYTCRE